MSSKRIPYEERKGAISVSLPNATIRRLDDLSDRLNCHRSELIEDGVEHVLREYARPDRPDRDQVPR